MKIVYKQTHSEKDPGSNFLYNIGISQLYFKHLYSAEYITTKQHHHTHYEIHIVRSGRTDYETNNTTYSLTTGQFILFPPQLAHRITLRDSNISIISISFYLPDTTSILSNIETCKIGQMTPDVYSSIELLLSEYTHKHCNFTQLAGATLAQILIRIWQICGIRKSSYKPSTTEQDPRLTLAIQYIKDNIEYAPSAADVSTYCHLSIRHLTRLFLSAEKMTPSEYIRKERIKHIETLLKKPESSLKSISERMHFSSEYYFNTFFKRHAGMSPGEFRKMYKRTR